jgi:hypothetical protein
MEKHIFKVAVVVAILSVFGMLYSYYFRFDCRPFVWFPPIAEDARGTTRLVSWEMRRDWNGQCYLTVHRELTQRGEYSPLVTEMRDHFVWDPIGRGGEGDWKKVERAPFDSN